MTGKELRIVFMGTPEFATESLKSLVENSYNVVGVVTAPDKPAGRGKKMMSPDVKLYAESVEIPVLQPEKLKDPIFISQLKELNPHVIVVVAFRMLPKLVWEIPEYGTFNLHASLLPQYRGAAPINWAVINGEQQTGLTTFFIDEQIDTGKIIKSVEEPVLKSDNAGTLHDRLMVKGAKLVRETVELIAKGGIQLIDQKEIDERNIKPAPKIFKQDCLIDWTQPGEKIFNVIRGLSPYPASYTYFKDDDEVFQVKVFAAKFIEGDRNESIGNLSIDKDGIYINVKDGRILLLEIQRAGKKRMNVQDFLNGLKNPEKFELVFKI